MAGLLKRAGWWAAVPLAVGSLIFGMWWQAETSRMRAGVLLFTGPWAICLMVSLRYVMRLMIRSRRMQQVMPGRSRWMLAAVVALWLANLSAAGAMVYAVDRVDHRFELIVYNSGTLPLTDARVTGGGIHLDLGTIPARSSARQRFWIQSTGHLIFAGNKGTRSIYEVVDSGVSPDQRHRRLTIEVGPSGDVFPIDDRIGIYVGAGAIPPSRIAETFQVMLDQPILPGVSNVQGIALMFSGYSIHLRFTATDAVIDAILADGWEPAQWEDLALDLKDRFRSSQFTPAWNAAGVANKACYQKKGIHNLWSDFATAQLMVDRSTGTVYFYGRGDDRDTSQSR